MLRAKVFWSTVAVVLVMTSPAAGQMVTLAWDPVPAADIQRYELSYGLSPDQHVRTINAGLNTTSQVTGLEEGRRYFFAVRAVNNAGVAGPYSAPISYDVPFEAATSTAPEAARIAIGLSGGPLNGGWMQIRAEGSLRYGSRGWKQLPWPDYNRTSGATYPAVGDFDGDGRAEIAVGLGPGSHGWIALFDDASTNFAFKGWTRINWAGYTQSPQAETRLAAADLNGDRYADLVVGFGPGSGGWLQILTSTGSSFTPGPWLRVDWPAYNEANGATWPAAGNLDDDPLPEIVIGLGPGSGGWFLTLDDSSTGFARRQWTKLGWAYYEQMNGETRPAIGNLDGDARGEIVIGLGPVEGQGGWLQIRDDLNAGLGSLRWFRTGYSEFDASGGGSFPAVGRFRR